MLIRIYINVPGTGLCAIVDRHRCTATLFLGMWWAIRKIWERETGTLIEPIFAAGFIYIDENSERRRIGNYCLCQG